MKMAAALPAADTRRNGLDDVLKHLVETPDKPILAIVVLDSDEMLVKHSKKTATPTVRILHCEPMLTGHDRQVAHSLLLTAYMNRTAEQLELPYEDFGFPKTNGSGMMTSGSGDYHGVEGDFEPGWGNVK